MTRTKRKRSLMTDLSRRERQIMDVIYQKGKASAAEVQNSLPDPPSYSAVRALLRILESKGHLNHEVQGPRYVYFPLQPQEKARQKALKHLMQTFFNDSTEQTMAALLDISSADLTDEELGRLKDLIENARREGK